MKKVLLLLLVSFGTSVFAQNDKGEIFRLFDEYCRNGLYTNASNLLVDAGNDCMNHRDTLFAYELQLKNCHFTDEHLEEFFRYGLTWEGYFANWYTVISLAAWLHMEEDVSPELLRILELISQKEPKLLPYYASSLSYVLFKYTDNNKEPSIRVLQKALDYIKTVEPSYESVEKYNKITEAFYINRFYNSFENNILRENRIAEIVKWHDANHQYIKKLDSVLFKRDILEYELLFVDQLMIYASTIAAQTHHPHEAIELYNRAISVLEPLVYCDKNLSQKIATCYTHIGQIYYSLGDNALCKEYSDRAIPFLLNHKDDFDYCDILNALALSYFNVNQSDFASRLKLEEMLMREKLGWQCSLSDWSLYFKYIQNTEPEKIIEYKEYALQNARKSDGGNPYFFMDVGKAFAELIENNPSYKDSVELYLKKARLVFEENIAYHDKYDLSNNFKYNYDQAWARYYLKLGYYDKSYEYYKKALAYPIIKNYHHYNNVALFASALHKIDDIHTFLPYYYSGLEMALTEMLPLLGSVESDMYLGNGAVNLYHIPEWASWNPTDSVSVSIAYDAALLMKGLTLRYNTISPYLESHPNLAGAKLELDRMRDSIYSITDENARLLALHRYELKEREILKDVNAELTNVHWKDIANELKNDEACIEFVKYTVNAYLWCDSIPKPHYSAMVLLPNGKAPIFVDLFDEDELMDVYNLQPKSYSIEIGQILYSKIWGKLQPYIDDKRMVFFSPMGLLNLINTELLIDSTGRTAMDRFNLYRVSSTRNIKTKYTGNVVVSSVASFGGVDYENSNEYSEVVQNINTRGNWSYLQNSLSEVNRIESLLLQRNIDVDTYTGANATEDAFKHLDGAKSNVIHIASHGYYIPQSHRDSIPYFSNSVNTASIQDELFYSGLILSGGQKAWVDSTFKPDNNDGILTAYEISKLDLHNVDLVVLSACETGLGDNLFDGIFGLQRAFKKAGVKSILMSLWQIDDKATSEYMTFFYEKLVNGYSVHDAYSSTVLMMKEKYQDANYYASFVLLD